MHSAVMKNVAAEDPFVRFLSLLEEMRTELDAEPPADEEEVAEE
jgi:hypothetical protein